MNRSKILPHVSGQSGFPGVVRHGDECDIGDERSPYRNRIGVPPCKRKIAPEFVQSYPVGQLGLRKGRIF
jgi:hypothetical protein